MEHRKLKRAGIVIAVIVLTAALAATAVAVLTADVGGQQLRVDIRESTDASSTNSTAFVDVPGANIAVVVPTGVTRLFEASFFAESRCFGATTSGQWCSVRIIASDATGAVVELRPESGLDYAFDTDMVTSTDDLYEGNAVSRARRLTAGTWRIRVQRAVTNAGTTFRLDDWLFSVRTDS